MKKSLLFIALFFIISCNKEELDKSQDSMYFLSEIRPIFFENLNFDSEEVKQNIPTFLYDLKTTLDKNEVLFNQGQFKSESDKKYFVKLSQYFSFYCLALTGNYLDGNLTFNNISGNRATGLFSNLPQDHENFEHLEMVAMMEKATLVIERAVNLNGYNDVVQGFYIAVKQVESRLKNNNFCDVEDHNNAIDYTFVRLQNYSVIQNWNIIMSQVTMSNYDDPLNTFSNPKMDELLFIVNARLNPNNLPDLGGRPPEIFGPLYRFDLNLKKIDHIFRNNETITGSNLDEVNESLASLNLASSFIENEKPHVLEKWADKSTFYERKDKLNEIKAFLNGDGEKPYLREFIRGKNFRRAYQCYSCHANLDN
jgi:hypothetical protein